MQRTAELLLHQKDVEILKNVTVDKVEQDPETKSWTVTLSSGRTIEADEYISQSTGTGHLGGWTLWGCLVWFFKGKDFLTYEAPKFLRGQMRS